MNKQRKQNQTGFTLIEILVVIAIIALLAGFITTAVSSARAKARDAKRKSDLVQIQKALEIYFHTYNSYPSTSGNWLGISLWGGSYGITGTGGYIPNLAPDFISQLPVDPLGKTNDYSGYVYKSDGLNYKLLVHRDGPESWPAPGDPFYDPARQNVAWMVTNNANATSLNCPGFTAVCW